MVALMKRTTAWSLACLFVILLASSGCARTASSASQQRLPTPSMADATGPAGLSHDSKGYMAADPP